MDKDSKGQRKGEITVCGNRERYGHGHGQRKGEITVLGNRERWTRTEKGRDNSVGQQGAVWTRTEKGRDNSVGQQGAVWARTAKDRESWRTLAEGYFLQWKDTA